MGRSMPKGGGGGTVDWVALAESNPVVMFRRIRKLEDFNGRNGATSQILADMCVLTGPQAGRVVSGEKIIGRGITNELDRHDDGADVPCRLTVLKNAGNDYCATQVPSQPEMAVVDKLFPEGSEDETWAKARKAWAEKNGGAESESKAEPAQAAAPAASDDAPW